ETQILPDVERLGNREVLEKFMRAVDIRIASRYPGCRVSRKQRPLRRIKSESISLPRSGIYSNRTLQLRNGNAIQDDASVAQRIPKRSGGRAIGRAESADQLGWQARLIGEDGSNVPASDDLVDDSSAVRQRLTLAEGQVVCAIGMEDVPHIKQRGAVTLT